MPVAETVREIHDAHSSDSRSRTVVKLLAAVMVCAVLLLRKNPIIRSSANVVLAMSTTGPLSLPSLLPVWSTKLV